MTYKCRKHLPKGEIIPSFFDPLISIGIDECISYNDVDDLIQEKFKYSNKACPNCDYLNDIIEDQSAEFFYSNIELPNILAFEIVFEEYKNFCGKQDELLKLFKNNIAIYKQNYALKGVICMPSIDHYTVFLTNVYNNLLELKNGTNYYYDGRFNNGEIIEYDNSYNDLLYNKYGYIFIYSKEL